VSKNSRNLTLVTPSRLYPETRDSLRFALRNSNLELVQLGQERAGADPVRLVAGRLDAGMLTEEKFVELADTAVFWIEPEDRVSVALINEVSAWVDDFGDDSTPKGLMATRVLEVDGEIWREHLVPRAWNSAAQEHLAQGKPWYEIDWAADGHVKVTTVVQLKKLEAYEPDFLTESEERLICQTVFFSIMGNHEVVLDFTNLNDDVEVRPATQYMLKTARAEAMRYSGRTQDAADLSMSVIESYENYPHAWFTFGCCALELGEFTKATGAFRRAEKASTSLSFELYHECSIWEWQSLLGTLFARVALGDIDGVKSRMAKVYSEVPEQLAQRLINELISALLNQHEVTLAWDIIEPKLQGHAQSMVPALLQIGEYYVRQEGRAPAFEWLLRLSSNYGEVLKDFHFVEALYELALSLDEQKTVHELLWVMLEFEQAPESAYTKLAGDLLARGRLEEAEQVEQRRLTTFSDDQG
jgi:tetratricopeptide (TPR) repeat protein